MNNPSLKNLTIILTIDLLIFFTNGIERGFEHKTLRGDITALNYLSYMPFAIEKNKLNMKKLKVKTELVHELETSCSTSIHVV